jgi:DNA-binding NarL/FixJ family response regulator
MMPVTVLLADEQALLREGVASLLAALPRYEVIGSAGCSPTPTSADCCACVTPVWPEASW